MTTTNWIRASTVGMVFLSLSFGIGAIPPLRVDTGSFNTEIFTFPCTGIATRGKIYLPPSHETQKDLPVIFLIDFMEQQFKVATDEFEKVVNGVQRMPGFDALVVTLEEHLDIDAGPEAFQEYYETFKNMASFVYEKYTRNTSGTFIGRGSEAGIVLMTLFKEEPESAVFTNFIVTDPPPNFNSIVIQWITSEEFSRSNIKKKMHFSFSTSNDYDTCTQLIKVITEAKFPWLQFGSTEYTRSNYENTYPEAFAAGIEYIFR